MGAQTSSVTVDRLPDLWVEGGGFTESPRAPRSSSFSGSVNSQDTELSSRPSSTSSDVSSATASTGLSSVRSYDDDTLSPVSANSSGVVSINSDNQTASFRHFSSPAGMGQSRDEVRRRRSQRRSQLSLDGEGGKSELKRRVSFQQRMRYDLILDRTAGLNSMDREGHPGRLTLITTSHFGAPDTSQEDKNRLLDCPTEIYLEDVTKRVEEYNKEVGRERIWVTADGTQLEGYIEVKLNLQEAIHVVRQPATSHNLLDNVDIKRASLQLVRLDAGKKTLLVSSDTTTGELIEQLVTVYRVVEDPEMFALFECDDNFPANSRKLDGEERPLLLSLIWGPNSARSLVLQEAHPGGGALGRSHDWREVGAAIPAQDQLSVPTTPEAEAPPSVFGSASSGSSAGSSSSASSSSSQKEAKRSRRVSRTGKTINWSAFSIPELNNFLSILDFEEERQIKKIKNQYGKYRDNLVELLMQKQPKTEPFQTDI